MVNCVRNRCASTASSKVSYRNLFTSRLVLIRSGTRPVSELARKPSLDVRGPPAAALRVVVLDAALQEGDGLAEPDRRVVDPVEFSACISLPTGPPGSSLPCRPAPHQVALDAKRDDWHAVRVGQWTEPVNGVGEPQVFDTGRDELANAAAAKLRRLQHDTRLTGSGTSGPR